MGECKKVFPRDEWSRRNVFKLQEADFGGFDTVLVYIHSREGSIMVLEKDGVNGWAHQKGIGSSDWCSHIEKEGWLEELILRLKGEA